MVSMFSNAQNTRITSGSFNVTTNFNTVNGPPLNALHKRVAPNAILNAGGRADEVRCHPGTRTEVISRIENWRTEAQDSLTSPIFWLSGPAGAGKTSIVQTIAEGCKQKAVPHANFFFFRTDPSRNSLSPVIATLLHQMIMFYPSLGDQLAIMLPVNPLIFESSLVDQLVQLIAAPLHAIQQSSSSYSPALIMIDGLDECDSENKISSQRQILHAFDKVLSIADYSHLFCLLVASRDESHIRAAFNSISSAFISIYLDDQYFPERDIRFFVEDKFEKIRRTHPLAYMLDADWPSVKDIDDIVNKSSGQFIYAATVIRFISDSSASPKISLQRVQGATPTATKLPFSHLDTIYTYILSQVDDQETLKDILHAHFLIQDSLDSLMPRFEDDPTFMQLLGVYAPECTEEIIHSCLADLTSIARYTDDDGLLFHHASFADYLLDRSRSRGYYIDIKAYNFEILPAVWRSIGRNLNKVIAFHGLQILSRLPPDLLSTLFALDPSHFNRLGAINMSIQSFKAISCLCVCEDDVTTYKQILRRWIDTLSPQDLFNNVYSIHSRPDDIYKYSTMAFLKQFPSLEPRDEMLARMCPKSNYDRQEIACWLNELLHCLHRERYPVSVTDYRLVLKKWISWAVWNGISSNLNLDKLPDAWWHLQKCRTTKWAADYIKLGNDYLHPSTRQGQALRDINMQWDLAPYSRLRHVEAPANVPQGNKFKGGI